MDIIDDVDYVEVLNATDITQVEDGPNAKDNGAISITEEFINGTSTVVMIRARNGLLMPISPGKLTNNVFTVRVTLKMPTETAKHVYNQLVNQTNPNFPNNELESYKKTLREAIEKASSSRFQDYMTTASLDYNISLETLRKYGTVYLRDVDFIVSICPMKEIPYHQNSHETAYHAITKLLENDIRIGLDHSLVYATNDRLDPSQFFYVSGGRVCRLKPVHIPDAKTGFYYYDEGVRTIDDLGMIVINKAGHLEEPKNINTRSVKYFTTLEELANVGFVLYTDKLTAEKSKDRRAELEIDLIERKAALAQLESDQRKRSLELEHELEQAKKKNAILEQTAKERDKEMDLKITALKHDYEVRSANRKDTSETIKWVPAIVTGLATILGVFKWIK